MIANVEEILGALELGVVPVSGNIDAALSSLSPSDARKAKRKFRKLWRRWCRHNNSLLSGVGKGTRRAVVGIECKKKGSEIIGTR